ncbi:DUF1573 domain-containing protein [Massilibacteroides sp.]|uniref:DUF1573 domain-containing protein n=1 Tax=Massilibacteroides sp. TaxID=2034766 RepID=UPI00261D9530|nr:DUF1573 domain-containing protein [Massilibacteroides sp.]MDD4514022.1 DUF1573 domain-containing protein [Massilibacteroides sp.]
MKHLFLFISLILSTSSLFAQQKTTISVTNPNYKFGVVKEEEGRVEHVFVIKNTGQNPLVIDRITTSCGCTLPEWSKEPVPPGETKEIKIWYDPEGRPGKFYKIISIFSNTEPRRFVMTIEGEVERKKPQEQIRTYPYAIGSLKMLSKTVAFNSIRLDETRAEKIEVKNDGTTPLTIKFDQLPLFITAEARPTTLKPGEMGELVFLFNGGGYGKKGRYHSLIPIKVQSEGDEEVVQDINLGANIIDNFNKRTPYQKQNAPFVNIPTTLVDFGKVETKTSILGIGGKESRTFTVENKGKSSLIIYSVTSDDDFIDISGGKKEIKPQSSATFKITIRPKDFKAKLESTVTIVCNDANGPVRLIKVTAEK